MINNLWGSYTQVEANAARVVAEGAKRQSRDTLDQMRTEVQRLESKIDGLALTCQALWEVIRDQTHLTDEEVVTKVADIDLSDGRADGRIGGTPAECKACGRPGHTRQNVCMYCGEEFDGNHIFNV